MISVPQVAKDAISAPPVVMIHLSSLTTDLLRYMAYPGAPPSALTQQ